MASAAPGPDNQARNQMHEYERFRELFSGRFSNQEAAALLERFAGDANEAANFVFNAEHRELREIIEGEQAGWQLVEKSKRVKADKTILAQVRSGQIETAARLFACQPCDSVWWKRIPTRKAVSKCDRCRRRKDAVPKNKEWGWALFRCDRCNHTFGGYCGIWVPSPCFNCGASVLPYCIQPPSKTQPGRQRQKHTHQCSAPNCPGQNGGRRAPMPMLNAEGLPMTCVHPSTRRLEGKPLVIVPSDDHNSSGSTVDTFLPQEDLGRTYEIIIPMPTIDEDGDDDDDE